MMSLTFSNVSRMGRSFGAETVDLASWVYWGALRTGTGVWWSLLEKTQKAPSGGFHFLALHFWRQGAREGGSAGLGLVCLRGGEFMLAEQAAP